MDDTNNGVAENFEFPDPVSNDQRGPLSSCTLQLQRVGSPTGPITVKIYADVAGLPVGLLATSYTVDAALISTSLGQERLFTFPNPTMWEPLSNTTYHLAVEYSAGDASNYINVAMDSGGSADTFGTSKILNGSWVENGPADMAYRLHVATYDARFFTRRDQFNVLDDGAVDITITAYDLPGGEPGGGNRGNTVTQFGKAILEYDDVGFRTPELVDRREFTNDIPEPIELDTNFVLDNLANGFALPWSPTNDGTISRLMMHMKTTGSPSNGSPLTLEVYSDTSSETGTVTTPNVAGTTLTDSTALFQTNNVDVGAVVVNTSSGAQGKVTAIVSETELTIAGAMSGGVHPRWDSGDAFVVSGLPNASLAETADIDTTTLTGAYPSQPPLVNPLDFPLITNLAVTKETIYHLVVEYAGGTAGNSVDVGGNAGEGSAELNGGWAIGPNVHLTVNILYTETIERIAREATPGNCLVTQFDDVTGQLAWFPNLLMTDIIDVPGPAVVNDIMQYTGSVWDMRQELLMADGSLGAPAYAFASDPDTGIRSPGVGVLQFVTAGAAALTLSTTQITAALIVRGPDGTATDPTFSFFNDTNLGLFRDSENILGIAAGGAIAFLISSPFMRGNDGSVTIPVFSFQNSTDTGIYLATGEDLAFAVEGTQRMRLTSLAQINTVPIRTADGTRALPSYSFSSDTNLGIYRPEENNLGFAADAIEIHHTSATGWTAIEIMQQDTRRALIVHQDTNDVLALISEYGAVSINPGLSGTEEARFRVTRSGTSAGFIEALNAQFVGGQQTQGDTDDAINWDLGGVVVMNNNTASGARTLTSTNERIGAHYRIIVKAAAGATSSWTFFTTEGVRWIPGSAPTMTTTTGRWDLIELYWEGNDFVGNYALDLS